MREVFKVPAVIGQRREVWQIVVTGDGPWDLTITSPSEETFTASGTDAFRALRSIRMRLDEDGVKICCNGSRVNVHPSPMSASYGAWMVYTLRLWRPPTVRDMVPTFAICDPSLVDTVEAQDEFWQEHLASRKSWSNFINPVWWIYLLTASWGRPKGS